MAEVLRKQKLAHLLGGSPESLSPMASIMDLEASCSMASDCRARTESGSIMSRMTDDGNGEHGAGFAASTGTGELRLRERPHERDARQGNGGGREHFLVEL